MIFAESIQLGDGCSSEVIIEGAKSGKGKHEFIAENEDMNEKIIGLLEDSITPFLSSFQMTYDKNLIDIVAHCRIRQFGELLFKLCAKISNFDSFYVIYLRFEAKS